MGVFGWTVAFTKAAVNFRLLKSSCGLWGFEKAELLLLGKKATVSGSHTLTGPTSQSLTSSSSSTSRLWYWGGLESCSGAHWRTGGRCW
jgi:hypothetical protein